MEVNKHILISKIMRYEDLTRTERRKFNEVLLSEGFKRCSVLGRIMPLSEFYTRENHDGYQSQSIAGKRALAKMARMTKRYAA